MFTLFDHEINDFIKQHSTAVIATVDSDNQPHTSSIYYAVAKEDEIYFLTKDQTTKAKNLINNNKVALTILDKERPVALNVTGAAKLIEDKEKRDFVMHQLLQASYDDHTDYAPIVKLHKGGFKVFQLTPSQAKMTDFTKPMGEVKEKYKKF